MIALTITPDIERAPWSDLQARIHPDAVGRPLAQIARVGLLRNGTDSGRATVSIAIELNDGRVILAETTYRLWRMAVIALAATPAAAEETLD